MVRRGENKMTKKNAVAVAKAFDGTAWHSGGNIWLVRIDRPNGNLVVLSDELICEYTDEAAFDNGMPSKEIELIPSC
jgi:hypothetical protein